VTTIVKADKNRLTLRGVAAGRRYLVTRYAKGWWVTEAPTVRPPKPLREWDGPQRDLTEHLDELSALGLELHPIQHLPLSDLLAIHQQLVVSFHEKEETEGIDPAFAADIERRVQEIESGLSEGVDALEALKAM